MPTRIQIRRDTTERWESVNPVLGIGEPGYDVGTHMLRVGDGVSRWQELPGYIIAAADGSLPTVVTQKLDTRYALQPPRNARASATIDARMAADSSYEYEVVVIRADGRRVNDVVEKVYPGGWTPGSSIPGPSASPEATAAQTGAFVVLNADAYESTQMTGMQIKNGVYYSGWGSTDAAPTGKGIEALAFMADGSWRIYRQANGDTADKMIADGVDTTYGFGPVVVENGAIRDIEADATWSFFAGTISARSILGRRPNGDVVYILVKGKTGVAGIKGNTIGQLALSLGCDAAILLDGGGTTQGYVNGRQFHPSSDTGGVRGLRSGLAIHTPVTKPIRLDAVTLALTSPAVAISGIPALAVEKTDGISHLIGAVGIPSATANTWYPVTVLPERFRPATTDSIRLPIYGNQNGYSGVVSIGADGVVQIKFPAVVASGNSWAQLDSVRFNAVY